MSDFQDKVASSYSLTGDYLRSEDESCAGIDRRGERVFDEELSGRNRLYPIYQTELFWASVSYPIFVRQQHDSCI